MPYWGGGTGANPQAESDYFKRVINAGDVTPWQGLFFNDPANDASKRTWYDQTGQVVPGFGTGGPAGPYASTGQNPGGIEQILNDMNLQRIAKTFNWQTAPNIQSFKGGGYWWSDDAGAFEHGIPQQYQGIPAMVQKMVKGGGGEAAPEPEVNLIKGLTPEEIMYRKGLKRKPNKLRPGMPGYGAPGGTPGSPPPSTPPSY